MGQIARWVPAYSAGGLSRPALALDENGNIILIGEAIDFVAWNGLKLLYLGLPASTPFPPVAANPDTVATPPFETPPTPPTDSTSTPPVVVTPEAPPPPTSPPPTPPASSSGSSGTAPPFTFAGITRPELHFDSSGNIILDPVAAQFVATYGLKALYAGLPASTPFPPVAATPPSTPVDSNVAANNVVEGAAANSATGITASSTSPTGQTITYALMADSSSGGFKIDAATGVVTIADPGKINFETAANGAYQIGVSASDGVFIALQNFTIVITNVAPSTPTDNNAATNIVAEGTTVGTVVGITALSSDINGPAVTYSLTADSSNGGFTVNAATGVVTVADPTRLDYETAPGHAYSVTVAASDGSQTASQSFSIAVTDFNDNAPVFTSNATATTPESTAAGTVIYTATATDADGTTPNNTFTFSLGGADAARFNLNTATGALSFKAAPNFEAPTDAGGNNVYDITITATDNGNPSLATTLAVAISVTDLNDNAPVFVSGGIATTAENVATTTAVYTAAATDADGTAANNTLTYTLGGADAALFDINANSGAVTFKAPPNFEAPADNGSNNTYDITVTATDNGNSALSATRAVAISVTDVNDNAPLFTSGAAATTPENVSTATAIYTAAATDADGTPANNLFSYALGGTDAGLFDFNAATGAVSFKVSPNADAPADAGGNNVYDIEITATDTGNPALQTTQAVAITVTDINDNAPVFTSGTTASARENDPTTTVVYTAAATDADSTAANSTLTYAIGGTDGALFDIDPTTGVVSFKVSPNFEAPADSDGDNVYNIVVTASDGLPANNVTRNIAISVTDANDNTPAFNSGTTASAAENVATTTTIYTATATDADGTLANNTLTYTIGGTDAGLFDIDAVTGAVTFKASPNFEVPADDGGNNVYNVTVTATDNGNPTKAITQSVAITVTDTNDNAPVFTTSATQSVAEGQTIVVTPVTTDVDTVGTNPPIFTVTGGADQAKFTINGSNQLVFIAPPNFESPGSAASSNVYDVQVSAFDGVNTTIQTLSVTVTDLPPGVPTDTNAAANKTFSGAGINSATGVTASSSDPAGGTVAYALLDDSGAVANGGNRFQIDASTGVVTVSGVTPITYDSTPLANNDYVITVRASDPSGAFTSQTFTITVDPNQPPVIGTNGGGDNAALLVAENTTAVTTVTATDADSGPSPISYSIVSGLDASKFSIVASGAGAGTLTFITPPDFENPTDTAANGSNTYSVVVRASDGAAFDDQTITVTVTDANDAPVITSNGGGATTSISVNENATTVTTVTATDQDSPAQTLTYSILNGGGSPDFAKFAIDASGNLTFVSAPNFEAPGSIANSNAYTVQVRVADNGNPVLNDIQTITVNVQNVNEAPTTNAITTSGNEDAASIAITLSGADPDAGDSIANYTITSLPNASQGVLYSDAALTTAVVSGQSYGATLYLKPAADFNGAVTFQAAAVDSHTLTDATSATQTIKVLAVNDAPVNDGVPANFTVQSGFTHTITGLSISDVDANDQGTATNITTTLTAATGTVKIGDGSATGGFAGGAMISTNGTGTVTLTGSLDQINTSLSGNHVVYTAADGVVSSTTTTLTITTNDQGHTGADPGLTGTPTSEAAVDTIQVGVLPQVWFIDSSPTSVDGNAPLGSQANPFSSIAQFNASSGPGVNDYIYLKEGTYTGDGINLKDGQTLLGDDQALSFANPFGGAAIVIEDASGARPTINVTTANDQGIDLASGNTIRGINITTAAGTTGLDDGNNSVGALTVSSVAISGAGGAVDIDQGGTLNVTLESASSTGGAYGIQLGGSISGTFTGGSGTLSGHTTSEFDINGGGGTISYGGTIGNGGGLSASIAGRNGGSVTLSGNITDTNDAGGGIVASGNLNNTITFSGSVKTLNTGDSIGVSLTNNTGSTINFTNGGLDIDTTTVEGFGAAGSGPAATTGGTVNITGSGNHITSTNGGSALLFYNTTIGASGLTFQDLSSNGAANGIVLNNTGTSGGLHVTGTGTTVGSGGTIQNSNGVDGSTNGIGIYLNNTTDVQLNGMNLHDFDNLGIFGTGVVGFQLTNSTVGGTIGTSTGSNDAAIGFGTTGDGGANGLTGTSLIDNVNISGSVEHNVELYQHSGQSNLTIRNSNIHDNSTSTGSDGILVETYGTADLRMKVSGTTFDDNKSQAFQLNALRQSTVNLTVDGNTGLRTNQGNEGFVFSNSNDADLTVAITNNNLNYGGTNIFVGQVAGQGTALSELNATITGNTINQVGGNNRTLIAFLSSVSGSTAQSQSKLLISGNAITTDIGSQPIFVSTPDQNTAPNYHATVTNNTVIVTNASAANGAITVQATQGVAGQGATGTVEISGNDVQRPNGVGVGISDIVLRTASPGGGASNPSIRLDPGNSGSSDPATVLAANNPASTTLALVSPSGSITVVNNVIQLPSSPIVPPVPLLAVEGGVGAVKSSPGETNLSQAQLDNVVAAALNHWQSAGLSATQLATLQSIVYSVSDLSGTRLGDHAAGHIVIDNDAAGHGWFVDPTPLDNTEFATQIGGSATHLTATASQAPAGHYDLLTTVMHEMGHAIGLDDRSAASDSDDLMYSTIETGERRLPDSVDVVRAVESVLPSSAQAAAGTPIVVGTANKDIILAGQVDQAHGGKILFGGPGADTFMFGAQVQLGVQAQVTHVADYDAAQGDHFDFSGLTQIAHGPEFTDATMVRAVEDSSGAFATLQINTNAIGSKAGPTWAAVAQIDGAHPGDAVDVLIGAGALAHLAHIHVDLLV